MACGCSQLPCLCDAEAEAFVHESGLRSHQVCLVCSHRVYGGTLLRCPECGGALELRWSRAMAGDAK